MPTPNPSDESYQKALYLRSSHVENILTHALIAKVAMELWRRDPLLDFQIFTSDVDDSGFDLVLRCGGELRYIQIKQTHQLGKAVKYNLSLKFSKIEGACVVVVKYDQKTLDFGTFLFLGNQPRQPMPSIEEYPLVVIPWHKNAAGKKKEKTDYRVVPRNKFTEVSSIEELVDLLFPMIPKLAEIKKNL
jgi:hypothetical protein